MPLFWPCLSNLTKFTHKKGMFNDNMDGTVSLVGSYSQKNPTGHYPPLIVSKRPLDPKEPPMRETSLPLHKANGKARLDAGKSMAGSVLDEEDVVMDDGEADSLEPLEPLPRPQTADRKSYEPIWDYIRPYLSVHKAVPEINWARHIIHLPRVRDIKWNKERNKEHPYRDSHARDIAALVVQVTGVESPTPCDHCVQERGPFIGCILISPEAPDEAKGAVLSCANCEYFLGSCETLANDMRRLLPLWSIHVQSLQSCDSKQEAAISPPREA